MTAENPTPDDQPTEPTFEQMLDELESVVEALESGELELADSLEKFRHGIELSKRCRAMLDEAQQTVEQLSDEGEAED